MSVPQDVMQRLAQSHQGAQLPGGGQPGPAAAPMATPQPKDGKREMALVHIHIGMNSLEQALPAFGAESEEGSVIIDVLKKLGRKFGDNDTSDLVPAQMKKMFEGMPQLGGGSQMQQQIQKMQANNGPARMPPPPAPMPAPMQGA